MAEFLEEEYADTLEVEGDAKSSARVLSAITKAERSLNDWQGLCDNIDSEYSRRERSDAAWVDPDYDLFWSSMEIMKPAVYAYPPKPVVSPQFNDRRRLYSVTAELLERSATSGFERTDIDEGMLHVRDDLIFYNRGQLWLTYETDEKGGGERICVEHLDRKDFLYPPARKWSEVPWVARRAWMTRQQMRKRFRKYSKDAYKDASFIDRATVRDDDGASDHSRKVGVWEVWHKEDNKVYWVAPGSSVMLDEGDPHLKLRGFFPCPRPAFGTLRPRSLVPVPDYVRYQSVFKQINRLTRRIYDLLDKVRMKGLIPAGGDIGDAVEQAISDDSSSELLIPVPAATLMAGSTAGFIAWLPLNELAQAIQGLISAREQLIQDFYQLSGISDIMRGATDADETLGAQRLKSQFGSVRVREKVDELQRIARDVTRIVAEVMAEKFSKGTLIEMSQMELPTKADISKRIKGIEDAAEKELRAVKDQAGEMVQQAQMQGQQIDPVQAEQQFQEAQQQIIAKYSPMLQEAENQVPIEDVMGLLRDDKARSFAFEIETDSTILTDEMMEKQSRSEFMQAFGATIASVQPLLAGGESGAKLAGGMLKFALAPFRAGRELDSLIDEFVEDAPNVMGQQGDDADAEMQRGLVESQLQLAQAEMQKAEAQIARVQADAALKEQELQQRGAEAQAKSHEAEQKFMLEVEEAKGKIAETEARIDKIYAEIQLAQQKLGVEQHREQREDVKTAASIQGQQQDRAMNAQRQAQVVIPPVRGR